jgi:hypothetical protein
VIVLATFAMLCFNLVVFSYFSHAKCNVQKCNGICWSMNCQVQLQECLCLVVCSEHVPSLMLFGCL